MDILHEGAPATYHLGSDACPMTVRKVSESGKTVWASEDRFVPGPGNTYAEPEKHGVFVPQHENEPGKWQKFTMRKNGALRPVGSRAGYLHIGSRRYVRDPSF